MSEMTESINGVTGLKDERDRQTTGGIRSLVNGCNQTCMRILAYNQGIGHHIVFTSVTAKEEWKTLQLPGRGNNGGNNYKSLIPGWEEKVQKDEMIAIANPEKFIVPKEKMWELRYKNNNENIFEMHSISKNKEKRRIAPLFDKEKKQNQNNYRNVDYEENADVKLELVRERADNCHDLESMSTDDEDHMPKEEDHITTHSVVRCPN